jgi:threonine/homoserine/homoserine lactone efflux protein
MTFSAFILFVTVYSVFIFSPGPAIAAVMARALSVGVLRSLPFIFGIVTGDIFWFSLVALGLAALIDNATWLFVMIKYAGVAYLLYLAYQLWTSPIKIAHQSPEKGEGIKLYFTGLSLCLGNPKAIIFFVSILPNVLELYSLSLYSYLQVAFLMAILLTSCLLFYAISADRARKLIANPKTMRLVNRGTGAIMAGAAVAIAARS